MPAVTIVKLCEAYAARGIDIRPSLSRFDLPPADVAPYEMVGRRATLAWIDHVLAAWPQRAIGIDTGLRTSVPEIGLLGYTVMACPRFGDALDLIMRYALLQRPLLALGFRRDGPGAELRVEHTRPAPYGLATEIFLFERFAAMLRVLIETLLGSGHRFSEMHCAYPDSGLASIYKAQCAAAVRFDQPSCLLRFPASWLEMSIRYANPQVRQACEAECARLLAGMDEAGTVTERVRRVLMREPAAMPSLDGVASALGISKRSLERHLQRERSRFSQVQLDVRMALADEYLDRTRLPVGSIAALLGYADESAFGRAYRRTRGSSPRERRRPPRT